jgi:hypothetical protein
VAVRTLVKRNASTNGSFEPVVRRASSLVCIGLSP